MKHLRVYWLMYAMPVLAGLWFFIAFRFLASWTLNQSVAFGVIAEGLMIKAELYLEGKRRGY